MSYSYMNAKKIRKRTRQEQLNMQLAIQKQMVNRLASALVLLKGLADKFADGSRWLAQVEEDTESVSSHGAPPHTNYIWAGEEDPTKQIKDTLDQVMEKLGPLSGMFTAAPEGAREAQPTEAPRSNNDAPLQESSPH